MEETKQKFPSDLSCEALTYTDLVQAHITHKGICCTVVMVICVRKCVWKNEVHTEYIGKRSNNEP